MPKTKTKKSAKKETTPAVLNVVFIWDMSGSMHAVYHAAMEGASQYISDLRSDKNAENMRISITVFDTVFERWYEDMTLDQVPADFVQRYQPRGGTALNDAVADAIVAVDQRLKDGREDERVLIVVLTDGQENSSQEYAGIEGAKNLAKLIKAREESGRWTFVYLGTGKPADITRVAAQYNIPAANTMHWSHDADGAGVAMASAYRVTSTLSASPGGGTVTAMADAGLKSAVEQAEEEE